MSTTADSPSDARLRHIKTRLEEMVERLWNPHRDEQGLEPLEVGISNGRAYVGYVGKLHSRLLQDDVIRTFDDGYYQFSWWHSKEADGDGMSVKPISAEEYYDIPKTMDARKMGVIEACKETGIHVPHVQTKMKSTWLQHFGSREEAERTLSVLREPIEKKYDDYSIDIKKFEIREFGGHRDYRQDESWYGIIIHLD